jgi:arginyl-tRNA synthetase
LAAGPRVVECAATSHEPHRIAFFLSDLSADFHALWNKGNDDPSLRFLMPADRDLSLARLALVSALSLVIASGLAILGVGAPEEMR